MNERCWLEEECGDIALPPAATNWRAGLPPDKNRSLPRMVTHDFVILLCAATAFLASPGSGSAREATRLDLGWRFNLGEFAGAEKQGFDDHNWLQVTLPHNWGWETAQKGEKYYRGSGWYRRDVNTLSAGSGKRYFVRFDAAGSVADVYFNGTLLGQHRGAFGAFCFEITRHVSADGHNLLAVRVSNAPEPDVAPLSGDFDMFGGLYRHVSLIETDDVCFAVTDHASPGVAWHQSSVTPERAVLDLTAQISNKTALDGDFILAAVVLDASGERVAENKKLIHIVPEVTAPFTVQLVVSRPRLWDGTNDPYIYRAVVELRSKEGTLHDAVEQPLGLRSFRVDPEKGFFLNGKPYHLHGVNRHQDRSDKGWAISEADMRQDMAFIRELGCTVIRCAHYQHSEYFYNLCDSVGILVWAELPLVNEINPTPEFANTSRDQLIDLIRQNINHPSIFVWSLFNELWPGRPDPHRLLQDLEIIANGEDPTRPTIAATATEHLPQMNRIPDLLGWNIYPGWYSGWGTKEAFGPLADRGRSMSRSGGICVSEYGAGANVEHHEQNPKAPTTDGQWHPEEWQALVHESAWAALKSRPFIWGTFVWNMFDFTSSSRHEGGIPGLNDKGLVTYDRRIRKDAFFYYRANWSAEPSVYITSRRHTIRNIATTDVKVYSNRPDVELSVNGVLQGKRVDGGNCVYIWKEVQLRPGENEIEARAHDGGRTVQDECVWTYASR